LSTFSLCSSLNVTHQVYTPTKQQATLYIDKCWQLLIIDVNKLASTEVLQFIWRIPAEINFLCMKFLSHL
jgi:hypothetical protein